MITIFYRRKSGYVDDKTFYYDECEWNRSTNTLRLRRSDCFMSINLDEQDDIVGVSIRGDL